MWDELSLAGDLGGGATPPQEERVLVAVITHPRDWEIVRTERWYRIPYAHAPRPVTADYLAFYHTARFPDLKWTIAFYAPISHYALQRRRDLLPQEPDHPRAEEPYYRLEIGPLMTLPQPIHSTKLRRVAFIHTTLARLLQAQEINELWDREVARDRLWRALRLREIRARRDYCVREGGAAYRADLAVFCRQRNLAVACVPLGEETDQAAGPSSEGWDWQCFGVAEIMADPGGCAELVHQRALANGGAAPA